MQSGVTVSCFFLSYVIVLILELSRLYLKMPFRMLVVLTMSVLGLMTHALFLWDRCVEVQRTSGHWSMPATLFDWSLMAAWALVAIYVFLALRRPTNAIGPFLLPLVLAMILGALVVREGQPFDRTASTGLWRYIHGGSLSLGTVAVTLGFAAALMNLVQEYRLKTKRGMSVKLRLPSLEYLHTLGRSCLVVSTIAIACGLVSGVGLNFQRHGSVNWLESGIIFSGGLLVWLVIASILEWQAALRASSWAAYLNIASFLIVLVALVLVFAAPHGRMNPPHSKSLSPPSPSSRSSGFETQHSLYFPTRTQAIAGTRTRIVGHRIEYEYRKLSTSTSTRSGKSKAGRSPSGRREKRSSCRSTTYPLEVSYSLTFSSGHPSPLPGVPRRGRKRLFVT